MARRVVVVLLVVAGLGVLGVELGSEAYAIGRAGPGDCVLPPAFPGLFDPPTYDRVTCNPTDGHQLVVRDLRATTKGCLDVPGAVRAFPVGGTVLCLGDPAADPARAINGVRVGECIASTGGDLPVTTSCDRPGHWRVLLVLREVDHAAVKASEEGTNQPRSICADAPGTLQIYSWGLTPLVGGAAYPPPAEPAVWDRVLCLGQ